MRSKNSFIFFVVLLFLFLSLLVSQEQTMGLFINQPQSYNGYTLFAPNRYTKTYLINNNGLEINSWQSAFVPGQAVYFLENGNLLRTGRPNDPGFNSGGFGGLVEEFSWEGNLVWQFFYSTDEYRQHHDIEYLPNGNVLIIAWELKTAADAIAAGRKPSLLNDGELWPDHLIEVEPTSDSGGNIVWEWHVWDHLIQDHDPTKDNYGVVEEHPELIDINYPPAPVGGNADWNHINSIDYNEYFDQIILSVHNLNEIWIIDHSTTTEEAAGHSGGNSGMGGDIMYRWGNPQAYDAGTSEDQILFGQHDAQWIKEGLPGEGNILIYNNGMNRPDGEYSSIEEIVTPVDNEGNYPTPETGESFPPETTIWSYQADPPTDFYSKNISGAQRMPNGNTLICEGAYGTFFEVTPDSQIVWLYVNPVTEEGPLIQGEMIPPLNPDGWKNNVFKIRRYPGDYPGFDGITLVPGDPIEIYPDAVEEYYEDGSNIFLGKCYPNPLVIDSNNHKSASKTIIPYGLKVTDKVRLDVFNLKGQLIKTLVNKIQSSGDHRVEWAGINNEGHAVASGIYFYKLTTDTETKIEQMVLIK